MSGRRLVPLLALAAALLLVLFAVLRLRPTERVAVQPERPPETVAQLPDGDEEPAIAPLRRLRVMVYYPSATRDGLVGEPHEIFETASAGDRAKQILADLISGPEGEDLLRALPPGTRLKQVFVLDSGVAYVDFSEDLKLGVTGGSREELMTVYAVVDSLALNISEIRRVGILIDGRPIETLNGHLDLTRPLPPDRSMIRGTSGSV